MGQTQLPAYLAIALNAVAVFFVVHGYFRRLATKDDIKQLNDKLVGVENRLGSVENMLGIAETRQAALATSLDQVNTRLDRIEKKADVSLELHNAARVDIQVLQALLERLEGFFETPKLKSS